MTDAHPRRGSNGKATESNGKMPRWVKVFIIIAIALVLVVVVILVTGVHTPPPHGP